MYVDVHSLRINSLWSCRWLRIDRAGAIWRRILPSWVFPFSLSFFLSFFLFFLFSFQVIALFFATQIHLIRAVSDPINWLLADAELSIREGSTHSALNGLTVVACISCSWRGPFHLFPPLPRHHRIIITIIIRYLDFSQEIH